MKKTVFFSLMMLLISGFSMAQCGTNQVEIKIEITTDQYGEETYWTLSDIFGNVVMQGGQGGSYIGNTIISESICLPIDGCLFFDIFDTYGDGIFDPGGYKIYRNDELVVDGENEFGRQAYHVVNCPNPCIATPGALNDLQEHINGTVTLSNFDLKFIKSIFERFPECLAENESIILQGKAVIASYDASEGALFNNQTTTGGFSKDTTQSPGLNLERAIIALQQGIFDEVFTPEVYALYPQIIDGWKYNTCVSFPGNVAPPSDPNVTKSTQILANFEDPKGINPYYDINFERMEHALRPTGLYLAPGSVATVTVPDSLVGQDYYVRVGSHDWDLSERPYFYRLDRISRKFPINSNTIEVFNPLGGAISILVPYRANDGIVTVTVKNGVEAPFFSIKSFYETPNFNAELSKPGPWAVFESDNVMYTIPKHSIVPGQYNLKQTLQDWEKALRAVNSVLAREITPDKHTMYLITDVDIRTGVYSIGYPMSNSPINYSDVPGNAYFVNGPGPDDEVSFHEAGHSWNFSKFDGEEEALVNFPYVMALNYGLNEDLNEAVKYSFEPNTYDIDKTAIHRMVSNTFGTERDLSNTETDEVRYQHRGYGHYFEIVNILGWCPLRNFWRQESIDFDNGIDIGVYRENDGRILRMSVAAQADLRPLFHVFGIVSEDATTMQNEMDAAGIQPSLQVYNRLQEYIPLIPKNNAEFVSYALSVYPNLYTDGPTDDPNYGVGWHYLKSLSYNEAEAQERTNNLLNIINLYYPNGAPINNVSPDVCCTLDTMNLEVANEEVIVTGGVTPYEITASITGNVKTVTVKDYDGCESTIEFIVNSLNEENVSGVKVYPNPASSEIYIDITDNITQLERIQLVSINGQVVKQFKNNDRIIDISTLGEGIYILKIELSGGEQINKRIIVLKSN